jgi:hypothetical protein
MQSESKLSEDRRARAIAKLKLELSKDIGRATEIAKKFGLWDLLRLCYLLRLNRICVVAPEFRDKMTHADLIANQLTDESLKYAIALVAKHGNWNSDASKIHSIKGFDNERVIKLSEITRYINSKFETEKLLHVADVRVSGERDQDAVLDIHAGLANPERAMYFDFGIRVEQFTMRMKDRLLPMEELVRKLYIDYVDVADLFEIDNGISLSEYCEGIATLGFEMKARGKEANEICANEHGVIFPNEIRVFIATARSMIFTDSELQILRPEFLAYLRKHPFEAEQQSDAELRFHYLSRRPFFMGKGFSILSPDLIFDSVLDNAHYTLLESEASKPKYMERKSAQFIDQIVSTASAEGYEEIERDLYLYEGKDTIGDIDLVMRNAESGHTLLIEAKNHALPLDIYSVTPDAIDRHVDRTRDWEKKVKRRISHVQAENSSYPQAGVWDYIVVSRMPEPYSHVTDLLVLSLDEFRFWIKANPRPTVFSELYDAMYKLDRPNISIEELRELQEQKFLLASFDPEAVATVLQRSAD